MACPRPGANASSGVHPLGRERLARGFHNPRADGEVLCLRFIAHAVPVAAEVVLYGYHARCNLYYWGIFGVISPGMIGGYFYSDMLHLHLF